MGVADHIATIRSFYGSGPADVDQDRVAFASPDIVWHVPGENRVSGDYRGARSVFETMPASMQPLDRWEIDLHDVMGNGQLVIATVAIRGLRYGRSLETRGAHLFRMHDGVIHEAWGFAVDQAGLDELLEPA